MARELVLNCVGTKFSGATSAARKQRRYNMKKFLQSFVFNCVVAECGRLIAICRALAT